MNEKIKFSQLTWPVQTGVIIAWIFGILYSTLILSIAVIQTMGV
jgi:hypothetical protein